MSQKFKAVPRVIITGDRAGKSFVKQDSLATNVKEHFKGLIISDIWATDTMPVDIDKKVEIENTGLPIVPSNGSYVRYVTIPPDAELGIEAKEGQPHPLMHQTDTLDYIIILQGELYLILDTEEILLKQGDIVIQTATNHAWSNRTNETVIQLAILLDAKQK